jgi:hypothetical protein
LYVVATVAEGESKKLIVTLLVELPPTEKGRIALAVILELAASPIAKFVEPLTNR